MPTTETTKLSAILIIPVFLTVLATGQPQITAIEDNQGNQFNFTEQQNQNGTITYGEGTQRYGRVTDQVKIKNNSRMEICVEKSSPELKLNAWLGASQQAHPANTGFEETTQDECFEWNINSTYIEENNFRISVWSRDQNGNFTHNNRSRSDFYTGIRYENATITENQSVKNKTSILGKLVNWLRGLM